MAHRETVLCELFGGSPPLGLDCGRFLDLDPAGGRIASACTLKGLARMGLRAAAVTARDMFYGVDFIRRIADSTGIVFVCANILWEDSGSSVFPAWETLPLDNLTLAVTALAQCQAGRRFPGLGTWATVPPDSVLEDVRGTIPEGADLVVLLTDMDEESLGGLLPRFPEVDIVLTSSRKVHSKSPFKIGGVHVVHPRPDGGSVEVVVIPRSSVRGCSAIGYLSRPLGTQIAPNPETDAWLRRCLRR